MPRTEQKKRATGERKSERLMAKNRAAGTTKTSKKKERVPIMGERQSLRIKERNRSAGVGFGIGLLAGGVGGWAVGRAMSADDVRRVRYLEARNRELEEELRRRR
jgi:hypothetical protein